MKYFTEKIVNIRSEIASSTEQSPVTDNTSKVNHCKNSLHTFKKLDVAELGKIMFSMNSKSDILNPYSRLVAEAMFLIFLLQFYLK